MVQNADAMFIDVVPMEAINEADMKAKVTLSHATSFEINRSI